MIGNIFERLVTPRGPDDTIQQVKFRTTKEQWKKFRSVCKRRNVFITDVLNNFIDWFLQQDLWDQAMKNVDEKLKGGELFPPVDLTPKIPTERPVFPSSPNWPPVSPGPFVQPWERVAHKCSTCGLVWEGAMGYVCQNSACPMQPKVTCGSSTS